MKPVVVRNVAIGEAIPKICVPIVGKTIDEILNQAKHRSRCSGVACGLVRGSE